MSPIRFRDVVTVQSVGPTEGHWGNLPLDASGPTQPEEKEASVSSPSSTF